MARRACGGPSASLARPRRVGCARSAAPARPDRRARPPDRRRGARRAGPAGAPPCSATTGRSSSPRWTRSAAARTYRAEQAGEFANLAAVPLAAWRYRVVGPIQRPAGAAGGHGALRHARPAAARDASSYELRGIDTAADAHDQYLSFVSRRRTHLVAGDDPLAGEDTASWLPPWHYGPLAAARGAASLVLGPPADRSRLAALASAVDAAIAAVTAVWGTGWAQRVAVLVPASAQEFRALSGTSGIGRVSGRGDRRHRPGHRPAVRPAVGAQSRPAGRADRDRTAASCCATRSPTSPRQPTPRTSRLAGSSKDSPITSAIWAAGSR